MTAIQTFIITGSASNIGLAISAALLEANYGVIAFDIDQSGLQHPLLQHHNCQTYCCDLRSIDNIMQCFSDINEQTQLVGLINCAGQIASKPLVSLFDDASDVNKDWFDVINNNLTSTYLMTKVFAKTCLNKRQKAVIINFSSIAATGNAGQSAYAAAKAGIEALTKVWSKELATFNLRCVAIAPGFIDTESTQSELSEQHRRQWIEATPLKRLGRVDEIIQTVMYCINNEYLNGCVIPVNGGLVL